MNSQNYEFPDLDSGFHINISKRSNIPPAFQNSDDDVLDYQQQPFQVQAETFYPSVDMQTVAKEHHGNINISNNMVQSDQSFVDLPTTNLRNPDPACPLFSNMNMSQGTQSLLSGPCGLINQQFCPEYGDKTSGVASLPNLQQSTFLNSSSQSLQCQQRQGQFGNNETASHSSAMSSSLVQPEHHMSSLSSVSKFSGPDTLNVYPHLNSIPQTNSNPFESCSGGNVSLAQTTSNNYENCTDSMSFPANFVTDSSVRNDFSGVSSSTFPENLSEQCASTAIPIQDVCRSENMGACSSIQNLQYGTAPWGIETSSHYAQENLVPEARSKNEDKHSHSLSLRLAQDTPTSCLSGKEANVERDRNDSCPATSTSDLPPETFSTFPETLSQQRPSNDIPVQDIYESSLEECSSAAACVAVKSRNNHQENPSDEECLKNQDEGSSAQSLGAHNESVMPYVPRYKSISTEDLNESFPTSTAELPSEGSSGLLTEVTDSNKENGNSSEEGAICSENENQGHPQDVSSHLMGSATKCETQVSQTAESTKEVSGLSSNKKTISDQDGEKEVHYEKNSQENLIDTHDDETGTSRAGDAKPLSPMITVMNSDFDESETLIKSEQDKGTEEDTSTEKNEDVTSNAPLTRMSTGALKKNKLSQMFEHDDLSDSDSKDDWEYEEGVELAPSIVDPSITAPHSILNVSPEELAYYHKKFSDGVEMVLKMWLHCTVCGKHIGAAPNYIHQGNRHKVLRVLICNKCRAFYGAGRFKKDSDGSELYCRWCGQGGEIICCSHCPNVFCAPCIKRNFGPTQLNTITGLSDWSCYVCTGKELWDFRAICWALLTFTMQKKKLALNSTDFAKVLSLEEDTSKCCSFKNHKKRNVQHKKKLPTSKERVSQGLNCTVSGPEGIQFGHFLLDEGNFPEATSEVKEEDDFIDPSQFVEPVLEEVHPSPPRTVSAPRQPPPPGLVQAGTRLPSKPTASLIRPLPMTRTLAQVSGPTRMQLRPMTPQQFTRPRIIIRQGSMMQPGLIPITCQPNRIVMPNRHPVMSVVPQGQQGPSRTLLRTPQKSPGSLLNNLDGVRSIEQLQSLEQVPWFRDGIDNIRSVGFALTKRIRELEARFHSLKNKQDVEKVMILGKKLERLSQRTALRFKQINMGMKEACSKWHLQRRGKLGPNIIDPFSNYPDHSSDWDDDVELSKPLEKVMIPLNSSCFQGGQSKGVPQPPPLVRTTVPQIVTVQRSIGDVRKVVSSIQPFIRQTGQPIRMVSSNGNSVTISGVRIPGPKSSVSLLQQTPLKPQGSTAGTHIRMKTQSAVSIGVAPLKRRRIDSNGSENSDIMICSTIPELLDVHKIKPCKVTVTKDDDFIVSYLEKQEETRAKSSGDSAYDETECLNSPVNDPLCDLEEERSHQEAEDSAMTGDVDKDNALGTTENSSVGSNQENDDDIEIIHEVVD